MLSIILIARSASPSRSAVVAFSTLRITSAGTCGRGGAGARGGRRQRGDETTRRRARRTAATGRPTDRSIFFDTHPPRIGLRWWRETTRRREGTRLSGVHLRRVIQRHRHGSGLLGTFPRTPPLPRVSSFRGRGARETAARSDRSIPRSTRCLFLSGVSGVSATVARSARRRLSIPRAAPPRDREARSPCLRGGVHAPALARVSRSAARGRAKPPVVAAAAQR